MKIKLVIITLFLLFILNSCKNSTEPSEIELIELDGITNITEVNQFGSFIGNIDRTDWDGSSYDGIYFGSNFWFKEPKDKQIKFYSKIPNKKIIVLISFYNYSETVINLTSNVDYPFSLNKSSLDLLTKKMSILEISYTLPDMTNYFFQDTLFLNFSTGEKYNIELMTYAEGNNRDSGPPGGPVISPAYPNPTISNVNIRITLAASNRTKITVKDKYDKIVKNIKDETLSPGFYNFSWDLMDNNNQKLAPGYYRVYFTSGSLQYQGDIKIE